MNDDLDNTAGSDSAGENLPAAAAPQNAPDRIERINIEEEMQKAYIDY